MIDLNDLRHSINRALNLGRYTVRVAVVGGEQVPSSIDLDLLERDDDGFAEFSDELARREHLAPLTQTENERILDRVNTALDAADDHGPTVPAQDFGWRQGENPTHPLSPLPRIYEFALGDITRGPLHEDLSLVELGDAPDLEAATRADWVHVYDRVTRERRTLKRPKPDAVLKGLNDVAADLRGKPVEPPFGCYTPPVGPLTSTEGLRAGDIVRCVAEWAAGEVEGFGEKGAVYSVSSLSGRSGFSLVGLTPGPVSVNRFAFVARPGVWMPWSGGENPVPGMSGKARLKSGYERQLAPGLRWAHTGRSGDIVAFMVIDTPPASSDT